LLAPKAGETGSTPVPRRAKGLLIADTMRVGALRPPHRPPGGVIALDLPGARIDRLKDKPFARQWQWTWRWCSRNLVVEASGRSTTMGCRPNLPGGCWTCYARTPAHAATGWT